MVIVVWGIDWIKGFIIIFWFLKMNVEYVYNVFVGGVGIDVVVVLGMLVKVLIFVNLFLGGVIIFGLEDFFF